MKTIRAAFALAVLFGMAFVAGSIALVLLALFLAASAIVAVFALPVSFVTYIVFGRWVRKAAAEIRAELVAK